MRCDCERRRAGGRGRDFSNSLYSNNTVLLCVTTVSKKSRDCIDSGVCGLRHAHCKALHEKYEKYGTKHGPKRVVV